MLTGVKADRALSYRDIEHTAGNLRRRLGCAPTERFPYLDFFERAIYEITKKTSRGPVEFYFGAKALPGSEGITFFNDGKQALEMYLSERSYDDFVNGDPRAVFSAVHEFGHAWLHGDQLIRLASLHIEEKAAFHRKDESYKAYWDTEWQANAFAGAVLVPGEGLRSLQNDRGGFLFADDIIRMYGVSFTAAVAGL